MSTVAPVVKAAAPAAKRAGVFLALALALMFLGAIWVTDGFQKAPNWLDFSRWAQVGGRP